MPEAAVQPLDPDALFVLARSAGLEDATLGPPASEFPMHRYVVASTHAQSRLVALCDAEGHFHLARAMAGAPSVGTRLTGNPPALGFGLLLGESFNSVYRVSFESVNCSREEAVPAMHAGLDARLSKASQHQDLAARWAA